MKKNFCLDVLLLISGLICIFTGVVLDFHLVPGGKEFRHVFRSVHTYSGYVWAIGLLFHIAWHMSWIRAAIRNFRGGE